MPIGRRMAPRERASFRATLPGVASAQRGAVYDAFGYAAAATVAGDTTFFTVPIGGAGVYAGAAVAKNLLHTNLTVQGQLPAGWELEAWDIEVQPILSLINSDTTTTILSNAMIAYQQYLTRSFMQIVQDGKQVLQISPIAKLSAGWGPAASGYGGTNITAAAAAGGGALFLTNGAPNRSAKWNLNPIPLMFTAGHSFSVVITTPVGVVLPAGTAMDVFVHLDGILHRPA